MSDVEHVQIDISCTDFEKFAPTLRTPVSDKTVTTAFGKKTEGTGWDNPPRFNSMEERDLYYK